MVGARRHTFSHFSLDIRIALVQLETVPSRVDDDIGRRWLNRADLVAVGMPAPVKAILDNFRLGRPEQQGDAP
jgi:A/G-specific adenine glycosylase